MWKRTRRALNAALIEAAAEDDAFAPDRLDAAMREIFWAVLDAMARRDRAALDRLRHPDVTLRWPHWVGVPKGEPEISIETFQNHAGDTRDRVTFAVYFTLVPENAPQFDYWTLKRHGDAWRVAAIDDSLEYKPLAPVVATPWDDPRLGDGVALELAAADRVDARELRELSDEPRARLRALDLSLVDERTAPHVLAAVARVLLDAWAASVDGDRMELAALADDDALGTLLAPRPGTRIVIRRPKIESLEIEALQLDRDPPVAVVRLELKARRWLASAGGEVPRMGRRWRRSRFTERWTFRLTGDAKRPWRLAHADPPSW